MRGFLHLIMAMIAGAAFGWISAIGMIENLGVTRVPDNPNWIERRAKPGEKLTPYTLSYFIDQGRVPPDSETRYFLRSQDDDGNVLRSDCVYVVEGVPLAARWWSMAIDNAQGQRDAISAGDVIREADGSLKLALAAYPVPGSRLLTAPGNQLTLSYVVHDMTAEPGEAFALPSVSKVEC